MNMHNEESIVHARCNELQGIFSWLLSRYPARRENDFPIASNEMYSEWGPQFRRCMIQTVQIELGPEACASRWWEILLCNEREYGRQRQSLNDNSLWPAREPTSKHSILTYILSWLLAYRAVSVARAVKKFVQILRKLWLTKMTMPEITEFCCEKNMGGLKQKT